MTTTWEPKYTEELLNDGIILSSLRDSGMTETSAREYLECLKEVFYTDDEWESVQYFADMQDDWKTNRFDGYESMEA